MHLVFRLYFFRMFVPAAVQLPVQAAGTVPMVQVVGRVFAKHFCQVYEG